jgi:hypothetical protein
MGKTEAMRRAFPWRRIKDVDLVWHCYSFGSYHKAVCGCAPVSGLPYVTEAETAENPTDLEPVCPICLEKWNTK